MWCPIIHEWGQPNIKVTSMKVTSIISTLQTALSIFNVEIR